MIKYHSFIPSASLQVFAAFLILTIATPAMATTQKEVFLKEKTFSEKYLSWLFPAKNDEGPAPTSTLRAPFADDLVTIGEKGELDSIYAGNSGNKRYNALGNLSISHRSNAEVDAWLTEAIAKSLNFSLKDMPSFGKVVRPYYSQNGIAEFKNFLHKLNAIPIMKSNKKKVVTYLISQPEIISQEKGADNIYKWVYSAPIMLSYADDSNPPRKVKDVSQRYLLEITIKRTPDLKMYNEGILVDKWSAKRVKE